SGPGSTRTRRWRSLFLRSTDARGVTRVSPCEARWAVDCGDVRSLVMGCVEEPAEVESWTADRLEVEPGRLDDLGGITKVGRAVHLEQVVIFGPLEHVTELAGDLWQCGGGGGEVGQDR